ncbi:DNA polymerase zeta [Mortierella alpina]|nr:DNA polymerase zeta [Mortierella alpina]
MNPSMVLSGTSSSGHMPWSAEAGLPNARDQHQAPNDSLQLQGDRQTDAQDNELRPAAVPARPVRFKIRIADLDFAMMPPGPLDMDTCQFLPPHIPILKVPVIRVYGANEVGQKCCVHIHQAFPHFFVPYDGSLEPAQLQSYILQLGASLNHAASIALNAPQDLRKSQYVAAITPVKGIPFYGYHVGYSVFLKIYLFNPDFESRIVDLMRSGAIMATKFQPFEAHIPFRLQFFIDYNLYGMGWLELEDALLRQDVPMPEANDHPKRLTRATVADRIWLPDSDPGRMSHCEIEMDTTADKIINRDKALERKIHHNLDECFQPPSLTAQVPSMAGLWEDDARRRKANGLPSQEPPTTQMRDSVSIPWLNDDMHKRMVADLVREMASQRTQEKMPTQGDFDNFEIKEDPLAASFATAYESVDHFCPRVNTETDEPGKGPSQTGHDSFVYNEEESSIFVDESLLSQTAGAFQPHDMDTEKEKFKGLAGLDAIEEQDEDEVEVEEPPMSDLDDFLDEDFMDEADLWDEMDASDVELQEPASNAQPTSQATDSHIPQFDGGGDGRSGKGDRPRTADEDWQRAAALTSGKKRGRSVISANSPVKDKPSTKRYCEIVTMSGSSKPNLQLAPAHQQHFRTPLATTGSAVAGVTHSEQKSPQATLTPRKTVSFYSPPATQVSDVSAHRTQSAQPARKAFLKYVEIPSRKRPTQIPARSAHMNTRPEFIKPIPRLAQSVSDDPIVDDDDDDPILDDDDDTVENDTPAAELDLDAIVDADVDVDLDFEEQADSDSLEILSQPFQRSRKSAMKATSTKMEFDYPEPASPGREYFLAAMDEMWSSPSPPLTNPSFFHAPPRPTSPDLVPAREVPAPASQTSQKTLASQQTIISISSGNSRSPELVRSSLQSTRKDSFEGQHGYPQTQFSGLDAAFGGYRSQHDAGSEELSRVVFAEDSFLQQGSAAATSTQSEISGARWDPTLQPSMPNSSCSPSGAFQFSLPPPTTQSLLSSFPELGLPNSVNQKPYFSNEADVPSKAKVFGGKEFRVQSKGIKFMRPFTSGLDLGKKSVPGKGFKFWEPLQSPPSQSEVKRWLKEEQERAKAKLRSTAEASTQQRREKISQIEGPTQKNPFGYKNSPAKVAGSMAIEKDFMDVLSLEVHCETRPGLLPDPKFDPILAIFYCWQTEKEGLISNGWVPGYRVGMITHQGAKMIPKLAVGRIGFDIYVAEDEGAMMNVLIEHVQSMDPDILAGYEVHNLSWGYVVDRYQTLFSLDMSKLLSRVRPLKAPVLTKSAMEARDTYNSKHHTGLKFAGRHLFNIWRLIRGEVALTNYGFCNVVFHVLQQRVPYYTHDTLTKWWTKGFAVHQARVIRNYLHRVQYALQLIESQELVSRTSEFARVFGIDFYSVISRGSQYKVESLMVRLAKPENFLMISPSRAQVAGQRALEVIPMVMEPESGFYEDPVVVLDFQSLYPSVMIAYNYCYSTCLGKLGGGNKFGVTDYTIPDGVLPLMQEHLHIAPNGVMFVNQDIRRSLLARMLAELLDTRVMVKKAMKEYPDNKALLKLLNTRQLSLKFLANVTYGYTSASYSGRMPGIEMADAIVISGRETLERAIRFVNECPKWNAKVVYGDTDSMFVQLKGRTRQEAFEIGYDIAETITRMNPRPVKLKFEKVYHPCFLVTKKRYVGSSYETPNQKEPIFDAKGIETIRRDGVPAVQKIMETCIKTQDLSLVKAYFVRQLGKILEGRIPVPDLMFGKEVRMGGYSEKGVPPPGAIVSARRMELDPRSEPQYGERVPYVVVYGDPGARLTDQVVEPKELLKNKDLRLNGEYYIRKHIIPSMERIFQLAGADVKSWYEEMPRVQRAIPLTHPGPGQPSLASTSGSPTASTATAATVIPTESSAAVVAAQQRREDLEVNNTLGDQGGSAASSHVFAPVAVAPSDPISGPPRFKPKRKGGKGFVSIGSRIDRYYQSQLCAVCNKLIVGQKLNKDLCAECTSEQGQVRSMLVMQNKLSKAERLFRATVDVCSSCCRSSPNGGAGVGEVDEPVVNTGTETVACESLECTVFWQRRKAQDSLLITHRLVDRIMQDIEDLSH